MAIARFEIGLDDEKKKQVLSNVILASSMIFLLTKLAYHSRILARMVIHRLRQTLALVSFLVEEIFFAKCFSLVKNGNCVLLMAMLPRFPIEQSFSYLRKASYSNNHSIPCSCINDNFFKFKANVI